jgi:hypothetical protein
MVQKKEVQIDLEAADLAKEIFEQLSQVRPEHSMSFVLSEEGVAAIGESIKIAEWKIGGNKPKLKATALEILNSIGESAPGEPVNVNFSEYEVKAITEVLTVVTKVYEEHQE